MQEQGQNVLKAECKVSLPAVLVPREAQGARPAENARALLLHGVLKGASVHRYLTFALLRDTPSPVVRRRFRYCVCAPAVVCRRFRLICVCVGTLVRASGFEPSIGKAFFVVVAHQEGHTQVLLK